MNDGSFDDEAVDDGRDDFGLRARAALAAAGTAGGVFVGIVVAAAMLARAPDAAMLDVRIVVGTAMVCGVVCFLLPELVFGCFEAMANIVAGAISIAWTWPDGWPDVKPVRGAPMWAILAFACGAIALVIAWAIWGRWM